jgi:hypothetical protein
MTNRVWRGVRMREAAAGVDPEAPPRALVLPASWDDRAAAALAALAPGDGRVSVPHAAEGWIKPVAARARLLGEARLADALHALLLARRAAPTAAVWTGGIGTAGFVLNLAAFHDDDGGLDVPGLADAARTCAVALRLLDPGAPGVAVAISDLDGLLARLGLDYAGEAARAVAANVAALVRGVASVALAGGQPDLLARLPWPAPPPCPIPELAAAAQDARDEARRGASALPCTAVLPPGPADALLGVETGGIAPAFSPVDADGRLTRAAQARLAALGLAPEAALARHLAGESVLAPAGLAAYQAMHDAVAPYMHAIPPRPETAPSAAGHAPPARRELPPRRRGFTQKASVGGHRVYLRTGEYADGTLGEVQITLPREGAAVRGLVDATCSAMSVGLQHGVPLQAYVDALALGRFAPAGIVEGDPSVGYATSALDYAVRTLAHAYLGHCTAPEPLPKPEPTPPPLLPLDLPVAPRRAGLRLVARR